MLIDFGSSAPLLPAAIDGSRSVAQAFCAVPVGTCDYISPEILRKGEEAFVRMEMQDASSESEYRDPYADDDDDDSYLSSSSKGEGYGRETDWWSLGVMLYEVTYGTAPFFAPDIRQTYSRIVNHETTLKFPVLGSVSDALQDFLGSLLCNYKERIGRHSFQEILDHPFLLGVNWDNLEHEQPHPSLHLPNFVYADPGVVAEHNRTTSAGDATEQSRAFAFSALFQSSADIDPGVSRRQYATPGASVAGSHRHTLSTPASFSLRSMASEDIAASFIGFSWGPFKDAFTDAAPEQTDPQRTPLPRGPSSLPHATPNPFLIIPPASLGTTPCPAPRKPAYPYETPLRPTSFATGSGGGSNPLITPFRTLPRNSMGSVGGAALGMTAQRKRAFSEREALQQMINCVGMSARKKVLESGRKPRLLTRDRKSVV